MTDIIEFAQQMADRYGVTVDFVTPHKKVSQRSVDYRKAELDEPSMRSNENERCGNCVMYHASKCDLVEGFIQPDYVCDRWEAKPESIDLSLGQRHVRTVRGEYFFKEPIGTPITEAEYQQLLAQRLAAKKEHETGHPARVAAERAVRTARRMRGDVDTATPPVSGGKGDAAQDAAAKAALEKQAQAKLAQIKQQVAVTKGTVPRSRGRSTQEELTAARARLAQLQQERAGRQLGRNANTAQRATDRRISQGQTISHLTHPDTGAMMSKSEIGDTYEQLFATHGANLLEREFSSTYRMISHAQGGVRNTPLDFQLDDTYGGELKTISSEAKNQKTSIKKEEIDRKHLAIAKLGLQPLMVVQVVDQKTGTVTVYAHNAFASKKVSTMQKLGTYRYTASDFRDAQKKAGYARGVIGRSELAPSSVLDRTGLSSAQVTRYDELTGDSLWASNEGKLAGYSYSSNTPEGDRTPAPPTSDPTSAVARRTFFGDSFRMSNSILREGTLNSPFTATFPTALGRAMHEGPRADLKAFLPIFSRAPETKYPIVVYRGVNGVESVFGKAIGEKVGSTFIDKGVVSASAVDDVKEHMKELDDISGATRKSKAGVHITIHVPAGEKVLRPPVDFFARPDDWSYYKELTLPPGTEYRIVSDRKGKIGPRKVVLEVVKGSTHTAVGEAKLPTEEMAARLTDDETYQRLLDARKEAQRRYPVGDPRRVAAERAVRQARKVIHGGPNPRPTPTPKPPQPRTPPPTTRPGVKPDWVPQYEPTPPVSLGSGKVPATITHEYSWSRDPAANRAFQEQAKRAVETQLKNQAGFVKELLTRTDTGATRPVEVAVTDNLRSIKGGSSSLGSYTGTDSSGTLRLNPKIFPHQASTASVTYNAPFRGGPENEPAQVLFEQFKSNWWVPTDRKWTLADNVIAHEVGHGVNFSAFPRFSSDAGIPDDASFWHQFADVLSKQTGYYITAPYESSITGRAADKWATRITYSDVEKWGTRNRAAIEKAISRYAAGGNGSTGTPREMFAELWSEYTLSSNPRPLAKFYGDYVAKLLNDRTRAEEKSAAEETAILRTMPADVRSFDPRSLSPGEKITFLAPHVRITKTDYGWEITLLNPDGSFQGAYGRDQPQEVTALIADIYLRKEKRKRGLT